MKKKKVKFTNPFQSAGCSCMLETLSSPLAIAVWTLPSIKDIIFRFAFYTRCEVVQLFPDQLF